MNKKLWQKFLVEVFLEFIDYKIGVLNAKKKFFAMTGRKLLRVRNHYEGEGILL